MMEIGFRDSTDMFIVKMILERNGYKVVHAGTDAYPGNPQKKIHYINLENQLPTPPKND
jgi:hypothetical protein